MSCPSGTEYDSGLCYPPCPTGYSAAGTSCMAKCPTNWTDNGESCTRSSYNRGKGVAPLSCAEGEILQTSDSLCYPKCQENYTRIGPYCWQNCPFGFEDAGFTCKKPSYNRGSGHPTKEACEKSTDQHAKQNGCEQIGNLWFPICDAGFTGAGSICTAKCPVDWVDLGEQCSKPSTTRGDVGTKPNNCSGTQEKINDLCYEKCKPDFYGDGSICWQKCPANFTDNGIFCNKNTISRGPGVAPKNFNIIVLLIGLILAILLIGLLIYLVTK